MVSVPCDAVGEKAVTPRPRSAAARPAHLLLALIVVLALGLRTYGLSGMVFANPDDAMMSYFSVRVSQLSFFTPHLTDNAAANLLSWDYGWPLLLLDYLSLNALQALHLPITEATLPLVRIVLGSLSCMLVYLLGLRLGGQRAGLAAALLYAVIPLLVGRSRSPGGAEACSGFLLLLALVQSARYWEQPSDRSRRWLAGLCLGLYACGDVQLTIGAAVLVCFTVLWPRAEGYSGLRGWARLTLTPGLLVPLVVLFLPYVPAYLYAIHLGYYDQTYLGTMLGEHKPDWGLHLGEFLGDLAHNTGWVPLLLAPVAAWALRHRACDGRYRFLACWLALAAFPFLVAVSSKVTQASGYHEHLVAGIALLLGAGLSALRPRAFGASLAAVAAAGALLFTLAGIFQLPALHPLWPGSKIPYGGLVPNSGTKTAGYWVRRHLPAGEGVFVAHDPVISYWYLGRPTINGGYTGAGDRRQAFLQAKDRVQVAVIPDQFETFSPAFFAAQGFPGRVTVRHRGREVLNIYTRSPRNEVLDTEQIDPLYNRTYRAAAAIIPPGAPYMPGKQVSGVRGQGSGGGA